MSSQARVAAAGSNELGFAAEILAAGGGVGACCATISLENAMVRQTASNDKIKRLIMKEGNSESSNKRKAFAASRSDGKSESLKFSRRIPAALRHSNNPGTFWMH